MYLSIIGTHTTLDGVRHFARAYGTPVVPGGELEPAAMTGGLSRNDGLSNRVRTRLEDTTHVGSILNREGFWSPIWVDLTIRRTHGAACVQVVKQPET